MPSPRRPGRNRIDYCSPCFSAKLTALLMVWLDSVAPLTASTS
jgi:hypothetical protein